MIFTRQKLILIPSILMTMLLLLLHGANNEPRFHFTHVTLGYPLELPLPSPESSIKFPQSPQYDPCYRHNQSSSVPTVGTELLPYDKHSVRQDTFDYRENYAFNYLSFCSIENINKMSQRELTTLCTELSNKQLFNMYHLYACPNYFSYIQRRSGYENAFLALHKKIFSNHSFRKSLRYMPGFEGKLGFQNFIDSEAKRIIAAQVAQEVDGRDEECKRRDAEHRMQIEQAPRLGSIDQKNLHELLADWSEQSTRMDEVAALRAQQRLEALKRTQASNSACHDYASEVTSRGPNDDYAEVFANCYGTSLDKQLHEELCTSRATMARVQADYPGVQQIQSLSPMVNHFAALAKEQSNPEVAFHLSDVCYYLTNAAKGFGSAAVVVAKGLGGGTINLVTHSVALGKYLAVTPVDGIAQHIGYAGIALGKALYRAIELEINNPKLVNIRTKEIALEFCHLIRDHPEEAIATIVELLIPLKTPNIFRLKQIQSIVTVLREQEIIARTMQASSSVATKMVSPIRSIVTDAAAVVDVGIKRGKAAMQNLIKVAEAEPELVSASDIAALKLPGECFGSVEKLEGEIGKSCEVAKTNHASYGLIQKTTDLQSNISNIRVWAGSKGWKQKYTEGGVEMWGVIKEDGSFSWRVKIKPEPSMRVELGEGSRQPRFDVRLEEGVYYNPFTGEVGEKIIGTHISLS